MVHVSDGALIETKAEETLAEEQAFASLENAISRLSEEMKEVTACIRQNIARIMALNSTTKQMQHSIASILPSLNRFERNPSSPTQPSLDTQTTTHHLPLPQPEIATLVASVPPPAAQIATTASTIAHIQSYMVEIHQSLARTERK